MAIRATATVFPFHPSVCRLVRSLRTGRLFRGLPARAASYPNPLHTESLPGLVIPLSGLASLVFIIWRFRTVSGVSTKDMANHLTRHDWLFIVRGLAAIVVVDLAYGLLFHSQAQDSRSPQAVWQRAALMPPLVLAATAAYVAIIAPVFEEFAFRGLLFNAFQSRMSAMAALTLTAILFAAL